MSRLLSYQSLYGQQPGQQTDVATWAAMHPQRAIELGLVKSQEQILAEEQQRFNQELERKRQAFEAQYKLETSLENKKWMARTQQGLAWMKKSGRFTEDEYINAERQKIIEYMDLPKDFVEKTQHEKQVEEWIKAGQAPGTSYEDEHGNINYRQLDGEEVKRYSHEETKEGQEAARQRELEDEIRKYRSNLSTTMTDEFDIRGQKIGIKPAFTADQIQSMTEQMYPSERERRIQEEAKKKTDWQTNAISRGMIVTDDDIDLANTSIELAEAQSYVRTINQRFKEYRPENPTDFNWIPMQYRTAYKRFYAMLAAYRKSLQQYKSAGDIIEETKYEEPKPNATYRFGKQEQPPVVPFVGKI